MNQLLIQLNKNSVITQVSKLQMHRGKKKLAEMRIDLINLVKSINLEDKLIK